MCLKNLECGLQSSTQVKCTASGFSFGSKNYLLLSLTRSNNERETTTASCNSNGSVSSSAASYTNSSTAASMVPSDDRRVPSCYPMYQYRNLPGQSPHLSNVQYPSQLPKTQEVISPGAIAKQVQHGHYPVATYYAMPVGAPSSYKPVHVPLSGSREGISDSELVSSFSCPMQYPG